ncbi:hypothetical protein COO60DRAFT_471501 [Scenedesmus sp. NREL 46B-D3]|nr:hypothetical protein COO60DRAFT_471501 [Scenedesmus sp. NREL 46B-D3]
MKDEAAAEVYGTLCHAQLRPGIITSVCSFCKHETCLEHYMLLQPCPPAAADSGTSHGAPTGCKYVCLSFISYLVEHSSGLAVLFSATRLPCYCLQHPSIVAVEHAIIEAVACATAAVPVLVACGEAALLGCRGQDTQRDGHCQHYGHNADGHHDAAGDCCASVMPVLGAEWQEGGHHPADGEQPANLQAAAHRPPRGARTSASAMAGGSCQRSMKQARASVCACKPLHVCKES